MADSPTLSFSWLTYDVSKVEELIAANPSIDKFVFASYFAEGGTSIQLVAYAHTSDSPGAYIEGYDVLDVFKEEKPLVATGPVMMCDNVLSIEKMNNVITSAEGMKADYLVFSPAVNPDNYLYYTVFAYQNQLGSRKPKWVHGGNDEDTNPSPPAP